MADVRIALTNLKMTSSKTLSHSASLFMVAARLKHVYVGLSFPKFVNSESGRNKEKALVV
jgi:hypothetical protein